VEPHQWPRWNRERQSDLLSAAGDRLTKKEVAELCYSNYADAIISLESCSLNISLKDTSYVLGSMLEPYFSCKIISHWAIYLPAYPKPFHERAITDSIEYWPRGRRRSTLTDQIRQLSYRNGHHYGKIITPHWEQSERQIFSGGHPVLYRSAELTGKGDWDQAFSVWSDLASSGSKTNRAKAMYNMAVYYELEDRLDSAAVLLDRAVLLYQDDLIQNYQKEMHQRLQNRMTIRQQVERARLERLP
jgi:hypothetical protein